MKKVLQKMVLLVAVFTVVSHSILPHDHHEELTVIDHQHHDNTEPRADHHRHNDGNSHKDNHGIFSFTQMDENFVPAKVGNKKFELPVTNLPALVDNWHLENGNTNLQIAFGWYNEYPPPDDYHFNLSSRAPPSIV